MGTKRPNCIPPVPNMNMSDHRLQQGGKISRDPSPRPAVTAQSARERDTNQEEDRRRERDMEKMKDKARYNDKDLRERYYERERAPVPRWSEGEREWMERERRQEDSRSRNERALLNIEKGNGREIERGIKKGDTFPRMTRGCTDQGIRKMSAFATDEERVERRNRDEWEKERAREWQRERYRERERYEIHSREREEGTNSRRRPKEDEKFPQRKRYQETDASISDRRREAGESWARRDRYADRKRENPNMGEKEGRNPSPHRRRDIEIDSDRREREKAQRRDTRSEGDSDERELRKERVRDHEGEHSKSEGENTGKRERDRHRQGYREDGGQRYRDRDREREVDRSKRRGVEKDKEKYLDFDKSAVNEVDRERGKWKESGGDWKDDRVWSKDRRDDDRCREYKHRKYRERKERETDPRWDYTTGRSSQSMNETSPRVPPQALSSGEWSSNVDSEMRYSRGRDIYEEREKGTDSTTENKRDVKELRSQRKEKRSERHESDTREIAGSMPGQRRMWLESQRVKNSKEEFAYRERHTGTQERHKDRRREEELESRAQWVRDGRRVKEDQDEKPLDCSSYKRIHGGKDEHMGDIERETEGVSVDGEEVWEVWRETDNGQKELSDSSGGLERNWPRDSEEENVTDEGDRDDEGGINYLAEEGSDTGWKQEKDRILSGEEFVTVSSGGDDVEEREGDEDEAFQDCEESWECGVIHDGTSPVDLREGNGEREEEWTVWKERVNENEEETEKKPKYVFCVIGQTLSQSQPGDVSSPQVDQMQGVVRDLEKSHHCSDDSTEQPLDNPYLTLSRNDKYLIINHQDKKGVCKLNTPREEGPDTEETTEAEIRYSDLSSMIQDTETGKDLRSKAEHAELRQIKRDSQTERLLVEWRGVSEEQREQHSPVPSNPYADVCSEVNFEQIVDGIHTGVHMTPEGEAAQVQTSKAWTMSTEPKRHSQAPHLKWAKNVVRNILGHSEDETVEEPNSGVQGDQGIQQTETVTKNDKPQEEVAQGTMEIPIVTVTTTEQHSDPELEEEDTLEGLRGTGQRQGNTHTDQFIAMYEDTPTHTHAVTLLDTEGMEDQSMEKETKPFGHIQLGKTYVEVKLTTVEGDEVKSETESDVIREKEKEMYISVKNTQFKPHSADREAKVSGHVQLEMTDIEIKMTQEADNTVMLSEIKNEEIGPKESEMYLSVSNTLYKPNSCPILNSESTSELLVPSKAGKNQAADERMGESEDEMYKNESEELCATMQVGKTRERDTIDMDNREGEAEVERETEPETLRSTGSFYELGPLARIQRRRICKTTERRDGEPVEVEEDDGVGRDRRTRIFSTSDDDDDWSKSWGGLELRNTINTFVRGKRNSKFFKRAQLYQQYNEAAQNLEILSQSGSDAHPLPEDNTQCPAPSHPPARRPLPPLPFDLHPHSLSHLSSSGRSLPVPEPPKSQDRPSSPRLSMSLTQSSALWRDLPGVRNSGELERLTEGQRRLQEVQFEVVTSEASYCRSLDIVVEHFVKSKQLGLQLTNQDRNWLFSRLAEVRAVSHSFLSKLEEKLDSDIMHFTVCDIIAQHCPRFRKVYVPYLTNQYYQDATYQRLMNENPGFKRIVEKLERNPVCERLPFRSFLVLPFQRITRIKLLVQNIVKRTTPGTVEATQAIKALKHLEKLIQESNDSFSQMKNIESLVSLNAKVDFVGCKTLPLVSQSRRLIREGPVIELMEFSLKDTERNAYLHLFNDFLLISLQKEGGRFTVIDHAPVLDLRVENCCVKLHTLQKNLFKLHMGQKFLLLRTETQSDKLRWISALSQPHPEVDFSAAQDYSQMQCIRPFVAQQPDELSLDKADIILVHQKSSDRWVECTRLLDCQHGWVPQSYLETISNPIVRQRNLSDALKLTKATAAV